MCTLIALHRCRPDFALWIAANRDEFLDRPAEGPALRTWKGKRILAPRDLEAGGTWWGLNEDGVFAALTNRPGGNTDPSRRSRGLLVQDALATSCTDDAAKLLAEVGPGEYNPFNLFVADAKRAVALVYDEAGELWNLEPGPHVIGNADPDTEGVEKVRRVLERARNLQEAHPQELIAGLEALCRDHESAGDALGSPCVHHGNYGTRSSTLLAIGREGGFLRHADGPPCTTSYSDLSPLLAELAGAGSADTGTTPRDTRKAS